MKKYFKFLFIGVLLFSGSFCACEKLESYPEVPSVEFVKVFTADSVDALENDIKLQEIYLEVIDGDGNLGLNDDDTADTYSVNGDYYYNLFFKVYAKISSSEYLELTEFGDNLKYRIPYKKPVGQNKYLKAEVKIKMEFPSVKFDYDTIRYEFFVYDRALNQSNIGVSPDLPMRTSGYYPQQ